MSENWAAIQQAVAKALSPRIPGQTDPNRYAHDRALRVTRVMEKLAPALPERITRLDLAKTAALYAHVALIVTPPAKLPDDSAFADAAELLADNLKDLLPQPDIDLALRILAEHRKRDTTLPEAKLLSDAITLEDFGLIGFWNQSRQFHAAGKSLEQLIKLWKAQHDYGVWEARLRDHFHYEPTRRAASERLNRLRNIYESLYREHHAEDIASSPTGHF